MTVKMATSINCVTQFLSYYAVKIRQKQLDFHRRRCCCEQKVKAHSRNFHLWSNDTITDVIST